MALSEYVQQSLDIPLEKTALEGALTLAQGNKAWCVKEEKGTFFIYCVEAIRLLATVERIIETGGDHVFQVTIVAMSTGKLVEEKRFRSYPPCASFLRGSGVHPDVFCWHWR